MGLSGGMIWSLETDDFMGECGKQKYPLLHTVYHYLNGDHKNDFASPMQCTPPTRVPSTATTTTTTTTTTPPTTTTTTTAKPTTTTTKPITTTTTTTPPPTT